MGKLSLVALDSNCLSYLIDALNAGAPPNPADPLAEQQLALARIMFYDEWGLYVTPTVTLECARIRKTDRAALHASWLSSIFSEVQPINPDAIKLRTQELLAHHSDSDDCRVVAEAEDAGILVLLTNDDNFLKRLAPHTRIRVLRPVDYWESLKIARGTAPVTRPDDTNPLAGVRWWRWE